MERIAARPVPEQQRLALIRDTDGGRMDIWGSGDSIANGRKRCCPDLVGVVLYPAGLRVVLRYLPIARRAHAAVVRNE
jgi:hypothetical protein